MKTTIPKVRSFLYGLAKILGDIQAVKKGAPAIVKRAERRVAGRFTGRLLGRLFR